MFNLELSPAVKENQTAEEKICSNPNACFIHKHHVTESDINFQFKQTLSIGETILASETSIRLIKYAKSLTATSRDS